MKNLLKSIKLVSLGTVLTVALTVGAFTTEVSAKTVTGMAILTEDTEEGRVADTSVNVKVSVAETVSNTVVENVVVEETVIEEATATETVIEETVVEETVAVNETEEQVIENAAQVEAEVNAFVPTITYTNVTFKDAYNTYSFANLEEAKAAVKVATLSDAEANAKAVNNKSAYAGQAEEVLRLINEYRVANGLATVTYDDTMATAAMHRAAESAYADWNMTAYENGTTKRHIRPNFQKASTIMDFYGLAGNFGENFGRFQETPSEILAGWMGSSSHNALLLNGSYTRCGIGVAQDSEGYYYWIALFM